HIQQADVSHKHADTAADGVLQTVGDSLDDEFTHFGYGDDDIEHTADKYHGQCLLPGESQTEAYGVDKECIQSHTRSLGVRHVGKKSHHQSTDDGSDDGGQEYSAPFHAGLA